MTRPLVTLLRGALTFLWCGLLFSGTPLVVALPAGAQEQRELTTTESDKLDAVLLLDTSGSMLATDPQALRYEGAKLFVNLLRPGDRVAVIAFDKNARVISSFVKHEDEAATKALDTQISTLSAQGQYTDLLSAVEAARDLIKKDKRPDANAVVVLLSDGKMDPDPTIGTAAFRSEQLLNGVLPELKASAIKINTLYFSEQADKELLTEIALASEGASAFASSVDVIHKSFADLFLAVKKPQVVPLTGRGFSIDNDVQEATFYLNRAPEQELVLITPSEKEIKSNTQDPSVKWFVGQRFDVVTVLSPEHGAWMVRGLASADGFATVLTNLKLVSDWPNNVTAGEPTLLQVRLNEGDKPIILPEVSSNTRYGVQIIPTDKVSEPVLEEPLYDDGTHGDKIAHDGIFALRINLEHVGEYRMWLVAKGPTFDRRQQLPFKVKPPLIQIVTEEESSQSSQEDTQEEHSSGAGTEESSSHSTEAHDDVHNSAKEGEPDGTHAGESKEPAKEHGELAIFVRLSTEVLGFKEVKVSLLAIDEARKRYMIPIEKGREATEYEVSLKAFPHDGVFELEATLKADVKKRGEIEVESRPVKVSVVRGVDAPPITALVVGEPAPTAPSPWPYASGILLLNGAVAGWLFTMLKKQQSSGSVALPVFASAAPAQQYLKNLEQRMAEVEVDINDPALKAAIAADSDTEDNSSASSTEGEAPASVEDVTGSDTETPPSEGAPPDASDTNEGGAA